MQLISPELENYCVQHSSRISELARELMDFTRNQVHGSNMLIGELEASVLIFFIRLLKVRRVLELGTYTGFSALIMAEAMPDDGELISLDLNPETTRLAQSFWDRSAHGKKIHHKLGPALESLKGLSGEFDLIFIDADKNNYSEYLLWGLKHLSPKGLIITDNTLWSGKVLTPGLDKQTDSIRAHNRLASELKGYCTSLLPLRDGMMLITRV